MSIKISMREVKDVLIKVGEFIFPVDFIIVETERVRSPRCQTSVILGTQFLATSNTLINYCSGEMKLTFGKMIVDLNIFNFLKTTE